MAVNIELRKPGESNNRTDPDGSQSLYELELADTGSHASLVVVGDVSAIQNFGYQVLSACTAVF